MNFLIIQTGSALPQVRARHGDFPYWIQRGLGVRGTETEIVRVDCGAPLPVDARAYTGVIVTGSPAMVSDRLHWSERTAAWLRGATEQGAAILGICYGHQLLAHAFGGRVEDHPNGRELGTVFLDRLAAAADDALLGDCPARFPAHATHQQSVLALPPGAVALAGSAHDPHHAVRYANNVWGLQFHPEFSVEVMRGYVSARCGRAAAYTSGAAAPTRIATRLLRRFGAIAMQAVATPPA